MEPMNERPGKGRSARRMALPLAAALAILSVPAVLLSLALLGLVPGRPVGRPAVPRRP